MEERQYGYCRISTPKQQIGRQVDNIKKQYPDATIIQETYTGTSADRPRWNRLLDQVRRDIKKGYQVTLIFDEVSRMSRGAEEGFRNYKELYDAGVELIFLKEPHINTSCYREAMKSKVSMTGNDVDIILRAVNEYMMTLAEKQFKLAFDTAQSEVDYLHRRTSEGVRRAQASGKQVGRASGQKVTTKKSIAAKKIILEHSRDFGGTLKDEGVMKLAGVGRAAYYKYKRELREEAS